MASILEGNSLEDLVLNTISKAKQISQIYVDLTLRRLYRLKSGASLDFGGSEFVPGSTEPVLPVKRQPDDSYGWWELHEGYYQMEFNEKLALEGGRIAILQPHPHLLAGGCVHPTLVLRDIREDNRIPLWVPKIGIHIKENARISRVIIIDFE